LPSTGAALLEFVETDEEVYLLIFTRGQGKVGTPRLQGYALGTTRRELAERVARFQQLILGRGEGWETQAQELYDLLIKPADEQLKGRTHLVVVPDGWLWNLPFGALRSSDGTFLLEQHAVSIAPSLTALRRMRMSRPRARTAVQLIAFANPALSRTAIERIRVARRTEELSSSLETEREVERLGRLYGGNLSRVYTGGEAHVDRVRAEAAAATVLHLAVPATISEASPLHSPMAFAPAPGDSQGDGLINPREIFGWDLKAEMVVFSSSEALPKGVGTGRGLTGLSWAVLVAGCPSLLVSQWRVDMPTTTELMLDFHRELRASHQKAGDWRVAVRELWKKREYRHPYYWAGFVLVGDGF
jgi:CHAT domain-containing protein